METKQFGKKIVKGALTGGRLPAPRRDSTLKIIKTNDVAIH
ncbi:MAG TPA: hypothetical protein VGC76_05540 [Pyrinomonadaceae bacterium]|jgi:hypothetical protein